MSHIVTLCPPAHGHINPLACLGRELQARGHRVSMPQLLDMEETVARTGLEYFFLGEKEFPRGWLPGFEARLGSLHGPAASRYTLQAAALAVAATLRNAAHIQDLRADLVIVDQFFWSGSSVAGHFALPFITLCASHTMIRESTIPPSCMSWRYSTSLPAVLRNQPGYAATDLMVRPLVKALNELPSEWRLKPIRRLDACFSQLNPLKHGQIRNDSVTEVSVFLG